MLALATHEPNFFILREKVFFGKNNGGGGPGNNQQSKNMAAAQQLLHAQGGGGQGSGSFLPYTVPGQEWVYAKPLEMLYISVLREYLAAEFHGLSFTLPFGYDLERVIDDFIFLCFFVGNDFLPHLPSLDIRDGALDFLIEVYKEVLPSLGDYLTHQGRIN
eukprot:gene4108-5134_t